MDKTTAKIIEALKLAESGDPELAQASLQMASRLAGGSLGVWLESRLAAHDRRREAQDARLISEIKVLQEELEWLRRMLRMRHDSNKDLKKEVLHLKKEQGTVFDDTEPEKMQILRLKAELKDANQAMGLLTRFLDEIFKAHPETRNSSSDDPHASAPPDPTAASEH